MGKMGQKLSKQQKIENRLKSLRKLQRGTLYRKTKKNITKRPKQAKKGKERRLSLPKIIKKADTILSLHIRKKYGKCVLCGKTTNLTNGHLIKRGKKAVRWDENNCFCLCSICNYRDKVDTDYHGRYIAWFIRKYGLCVYEDLEEKSQMKVDSMWIRQTCEKVIKKYE